VIRSAPRVKAERTPCARSKVNLVHPQDIHIS
jgi:hypothetical protein